MATITKAQQAEREEAIKDLREWVKPGDTVWTSIRHVSSSGMMRVIQVIKLVETERGPEPRYLGFLTAKALGWNYDRDREGVKVGGCGMDMGFHLVYSLSNALYGREHGYECLGDRCPSSQHQGANYANRAPGEMHFDGYALNHRWL